MRRILFASLCSLFLPLSLPCEVDSILFLPVAHSFHNLLFKLLLDYPVVLIEVARLLLQFLHKVFLSAETSITVFRQGCVSSFPQKASLVPTLWTTCKLLLKFTIYCLLITCWFILLTQDIKATQLLIVCRRTFGEVHATQVGLCTW